MASAGTATAAPPAEAVRLLRDAQALGVTLDGDQCAAMLRLLDELGEWSQRFNLTSITEREAMFTRHLLDSLSVQPFLHGARIADLGTGAGFPGLPLAIANPKRQFMLVDSTAKKLKFVDHVVSELGLGNVMTLHSRIEALKPKPPFDTLVARALAPLPSLLSLLQPLCSGDTQVVAMLGRRPSDTDLAALPARWVLVQLERVVVPGLEAERHVAVLKR